MNPHGPSINDIKGKRGGTKNGNFGCFSRLKWGDKGREGGPTNGKLR